MTAAGGSAAFVGFSYGVNQTSTPQHSSQPRLNNNQKSSSVPKPAPLKNPTSLHHISLQSQSKSLPSNTQILTLNYSSCTFCGILCLGRCMNRLVGAGF